VGVSWESYFNPSLLPRLGQSLSRYKQKWHKAKNINCNANNKHTNEGGIRNINCILT
jgi:hypothetical protein